MYNTKQKKELENLFINNKDKSYLGKDILSLLKSLSKATLYRNLKTLEDEGIINKYFDNENNSYKYQYDFACNNLHLKCKVCNKLIHLNCKDAKDLINHINLNHKFLVDLKDTVIIGTCKDCSNRMI